jgi:Ca2+-dependent lipid-binding protein
MEYCVLMYLKRRTYAFVKINIGQYQFKTHIQKSLHPKWYETFEVPIEESNTQQLQVI